MSTCAQCDKPIKGGSIEALDKNWHPECFVCNGCRQGFNEKTFHTKEEKPYCDACYLKLYAPKCSGCTKAISGSYITALNGPWHSECFVCHVCRKPFDKGSFYDMDGKPICKADYDALDE